MGRISNTRTPGFPVNHAAIGSQGEGCEERQGESDLKGVCHEIFDLLSFS